EPELTKEYVVDGWVRTGDIGYLDPAGYLFLVDRIKDCIMVGLSTQRAYSRPIEDSLASHPQVRAAAVIGVPDDLDGEAVYAFVVPVPGAGVTADELRRQVATDLIEEWAPQQVEFVDTLPLTGVGKVDKKALRARYQARVRQAEQ
ncbi:MAG TPA: AMP-dependent synthetase, partial [Micromonosporaceae bacterium]|nr:AMP-dependent synthetase [Micromonosporaceae bacterium]